MATRHAGLCLLAACGSAVGVGPAPSPSARTRHEPAREPIDVLAALADTTGDVAWIFPGSAQLELGGAPVQAPDGADALEVVPLDERGNDIRVGVRLDHVRFAIWTPRARLLAIVQRDQRVEERPGGGFTPFSSPPIEVRLRASALVRRIAHQANATTPNGTCLYASEGGESVGYVVGDRPVALAATHPGWYSLALDTPGGPIAFTARGATEAELATCGVQ